MTAPPLWIPRTHPPFVLPCTRSERTPVCQLAQCIAEYNDLLWHINLEIREEGVGELVIASPPGIQLTELWLQEQNEREIFAMALLNDVITLHRCIMSIELNFILGINPLLLSILQNRCTLRKLTISYIPCIPYWEENLVKVLRKLARASDKNNATSRRSCASLVSTQPLETAKKQSRTSLTALDVAALKMSSEFAQHFFYMLLQSNTISDLTVGACIFTLDSFVLLDCFVAYLRKEGTALKVLTIIMPQLIPMSALQSLVTAILSAKTLETLSIQTDVYSIYSAEQNALFAQIISQNAALRHLKVTCPKRRSFHAVPDPITIVIGNAASRIDPWLLGLQKNTTLLTLALDLVGLSNDECCAFFHALALNKSLKDINITYLPIYADIKEICSIIRKSRLAKAVHIEDYVVNARTFPVLPECPELTSLTISILSPHLIELFRGTLAVLSSCTHVVSLRICVERRLLTQAQAAIAAYIAETRTLKSIMLIAFDNLFHRDNQAQDPCADGLLADALASNAILTKIEVKDLALSAEKSRLLASAIIKSQTLTELSFAARSLDINDSFLDMLSSGIEKNYSLVRADVPVYRWRYAELRAIRNVTARNASLVARATRFVMGDHSDYCAQAIELVSAHPNVLSAVQESAGVEADQAEAMIRRALRLPCLTGLDEYMKLTGVVRKRVECCCLPDGSLQLDELNYECWLHIRKFLRVADVVKAECQ